MEDIGSRIKQIVEDTGMSAIDFSSKVGIQRSSLSHLFSGRNKPSIDLILKIKKQFPDTDLEWLITGEVANHKGVEQNSEEYLSEKEQDKEFTNVNIDDVTFDNQDFNTKKENLITEELKNEKIDKVLFFYVDGSFKEYMNRK